MKFRWIGLVMLLALLVGSNIAIPQVDGCRGDMSVAECVRRVADIAQGFNDKFITLYQELTRRELPVGTVITSVLPPELFLTSKNPQFDSTRWVPADGRALPANSFYQQLTNAAYAPDLRNVSGGRQVLDLVEGVANAGQLVEQLRSPQQASANWNFQFSPALIQGNRVNNDVEQDTDQFEIKVEGGRLVVHGRTLNWKHGRWGSWSDGSANYLGIATMKNPFYYYVKIN